MANTKLSSNRTEQIQCNNPFVQRKHGEISQIISNQPAQISAKKPDDKGRINPESEQSHYMPQIHFMSEQRHQSGSPAQSRSPKQKESQDAGSEQS